MRGTVADAADRIRKLLDRPVPEHRPRVVNVVGPLGVGKSRLLSLFDKAFTSTVIDGVDSDRAARTALRRVEHGRFLIASRLPLACRPDWIDVPVTVVEIAPWSTTDIHALITAFGALASEHIDLITRLSGGIPLIADSICRALRAGARADPIGALAEVAATDVLRRIAVESPRVAPDLVPLVASLDGADQDLLTALVRLPPGAFGRLRGLSIVRPDRHGLTVAEPYRTIFDLAYRWRRPVVRGDLASRGAGLRALQVTGTTDASLRARLVDQILYLSARPNVHHDLYTDVSGELSVRLAGAGDEPAIDRLIRRWATEENLSAPRARRMRDLWLAGTDHGFHLAVDIDDRAIGMVNITRIEPGRTTVLEPLLQQHTDPLLNGPFPGAVVGMMAVEPGFARAQPTLIRHILATGIAGGRLVVSTPWLPYQQMTARFNFRSMGVTHHDIYHCGQASGVFTRTFTDNNLPGWLKHMSAPSDDGTDRIVEFVRVALQNLRTPTRPAASPLFTVDGLLTPSALTGILRQAIQTLADSPSTVDAQAGRILHLYYVARADGHDLLTHRLHLSRATYFRRLEHGIHKVAVSVAAAIHDQT